jgi:peptidyl-prolyl cis-trans isomerase D
MLDLIRKKQRSVLIKVVFWTIIAAFVGTIFLVWGQGGGPGGSGEGVARVNRDHISHEAYQTAYDNLRRLYLGMYGERFTPEIEKQLQLERQALDALIEQTLLLQEARRRGLKVGKQELIAAIAENPYFQDAGVFSKAKYLRMLAAQRMTADRFEEEMGRQLLLNKVKDHIEAPARVESAHVEQEYRRRHDQVNLAYVRFVPEIYQARAKVSDEVLRGYFEENREQYRLPERISVRYLRFDPERFAGQVEASDAELADWYRRHQDRFYVPEQVRAAHILVRVGADMQDDERAERRALAARVLAEARAGKDFAELARRHSEDVRTSGNGGALGYFSRGTMVPEFENVAFSLKPGEISDLVVTGLGFHIIRVENHVAAGSRPLAEVRDQVLAGFRQDRARQLAMEKAMDAYQRHRQDGRLESADGLPVQQSGLFARGEQPEGLADPQLVESLFTLAEGQLARPMSRAQGVYLFALQERQASRIPDFAAVRETVEKDYRRSQGVVLARAAAQQLLDAVKNGKSLAEAARQAGVSAAETGLFVVGEDQHIPGLGVSAALAEAVFTLSEKQPLIEQVVAIDGQWVVAQRKDWRPTDMAGLTASVRQTLEQELLARQQRKLLEERLKTLRAEARIEIDPVLQNALGGNNAL